MGQINGKTNLTLFRPFRVLQRKIEEIGLALPLLAKYTNTVWVKFADKPNKVNEYFSTFKHPTNIKVAKFEERKKHSR